MRKPLSDEPKAIEGEEYYTEFCQSVWFFLKTTDKKQIDVSKIKPENKEKWLNAVKAYIDYHQGQPDVLFNSDYSILNIHPRK